MITTSIEEIKKHRVTFSSDNQRLCSLIKEAKTSTAIFNGHIVEYPSVKVGGYKLDLYYDEVKFGCQRADIETLERAKDYVMYDKKKLFPGLKPISSKKSELIVDVIEESENFFVTTNGAYKKSEYVRAMVQRKDREFAIERNTFYYNGHSIAQVHTTSDKEFLTELFDYFITLLETIKKYRNEK